MAIEVIVRREYNEPKYLTRCCRCGSVLKFVKSDAIYDNDDSYCGDYYLECPVCGFTNVLGPKNNWNAATERLKGELGGN